MHAARILSITSRVTVLQVTMFKDRALRGPNKESDHWVPSDTYALANDFRRLHAPSLQMEVALSLCRALPVIHSFVLPAS